MEKAKILRLALNLVPITCVVFLHQDSFSDDASPTQRGLQKLEYNNPGLLVDLDMGFKSVPMPMDFDGVGDCDLPISESGANVVICSPFRFIIISSYDYGQL